MGNINLLFTGFVCALAVLDSICLLPGVLADSQVELLAKLRNPSLSMDEAERILKSVTNPDEVEICRVSVTRILAYKNGPCRLEDFAIPYEHDLCWYDYNGVLKSIKTWAHIKRGICARGLSFSSLLSEAVVDEDEEIFKTIPGSYLSFFFIGGKQFEGKKKYLSNCFRLVLKLAGPMKYYELKFYPAPIGDQELVARWSKYLNRCKLYTERYCLIRAYESTRCSDTSFMREL